MSNHDDSLAMPYRRLGASGLRLSLLSYGSWVSFGEQLDVAGAVACLAAARQGGINFFDTAEQYANGQAELVMGAALAELDWPRSSYVLSTKFFWGLDNGGANMRDTLNRKYLLQAIDGSLERLGLDFVDLIFCHRPDRETPIEETVWAMSDIVTSGRALYWGTSEWSAVEIRTAWDIAERHHLRKPTMEQPEYNLLRRGTVESELARLHDDIGLGLTTWSPLASGILTGKYADGIPPGSRASLSGFDWLHQAASEVESQAQVHRVVSLATRIGCTPAQLSIAWCANNPRVSTVITGASSVPQLRENLDAVEVMAALSPEVLEELQGDG